MFLALGIKEDASKFLILITDFIGVIRVPLSYGKIVKEGKYQKVPN